MAKHFPGVHNLLESAMETPAIYEFPAIKYGCKKYFIRYIIFLNV